MDLGYAQMTSHLSQSTVHEKWTTRWRAYQRMTSKQRPITLTVWRHVHGPLYSTEPDELTDEQNTGVGCSCGADTIPGSIHAPDCDENEVAPVERTIDTRHIWFPTRPQYEGYTSEELLTVLDDFAWTIYCLRHDRPA